MLMFCFGWIKSTTIFPEHAASTYACWTTNADQNWDVFIELIPAAIPLRKCRNNKDLPVKIWLNMSFIYLSLCMPAMTFKSKFFHQIVSKTQISFSDCFLKIKFIELPSRCRRNFDDWQETAVAEVGLETPFTWLHKRSLYSELLTDENVLARR